MKIGTLIGISIFTILSVWTVYSWMDRWEAVVAPVKQTEGFDPSIDALVAATSDKPNNKDVTLAYQTVLKYIKSDFSKGIVVVNDFRNRFFPSNTPFKDTFDPSKIMDDPQLRLPPS
jgi:hypothetical protein